MITPNITVYELTTGPPKFWGPPQFEDFEIQVLFFDVILGVSTPAFHHQLLFWVLTATCSHSWQLRGHIEYFTHTTLKAVLLVNTPIYGETWLGNVEGGLVEPIVVPFNAPGLVSGKGSFYAQDDALYVDLETETVNGPKKHVGLKLHDFPKYLITSLLNLLVIDIIFTCRKPSS